MKYMGVEIMEKAKLSELEYSDLVTEACAMGIAEGVSYSRGGKNYRQYLEGMSARLNPDNLKEIRPVFHTMRKVDKDVWVYIGKCFAGDEVERGVDLGTV